MTYPTIRMLTEGHESQIPAPVVRWLKENAPIQWGRILNHKGHRIYRGMKTKIKTAAIIDRSTYRPARNTGDMYKVLLDAANPKWPRRGYSAICSTDSSYARDYGPLMCVIPRDDAPVGLVRDSDLHETGILGNTNEDVMSVVYAVQKALGWDDETAERYDAHARQHGAPTSIEQIDAAMENFVSRIEVEIQDHSDPEAATERMIDFLTDGFSVLTAPWVVSRLQKKTTKTYSQVALASKYYKWSHYKCKLTTAAMITDRTGDTELWVEGPYVLISPDIVFGGGW